MKKIIFVCCCLLALGACNQPSDAPKYVFKTITPKFIPYTDWKENKDQAIKQADREMENSIKSACRKTSQGWTLKEVKHTGEMDCEEGSDGYRCRRKNFELECQQIDRR